VFLHGNHPTCGHGTNPRIDDNAQYTTTGTCPTGDVVVPSHRGYDYIASELASRGYLVVSINANRGINFAAGVSGDNGLNLARGRLILKHLQRISEWDRGVSPTPAWLGVSLQNHIDFSQVGLMGHSRGGEGVRAAYQQYSDAGSIWPGRIVTPVNFRAIFEIGPVDGQTSRILNGDNTKWAVILRMCDGDVSDLEGMPPYDRMNAVFNETNPTFKATYNVWGACHNYYNTEWQQAEQSAACPDHRAMFTSGTGITGSPEQRQTSFYPMLAFFTANVGPATNPVLNNWFDPKARILPDPPVYRGYTPGANTSQNRQLEDFTGPTGTSTFGQPNIASNISINHESVPEHDVTFRAANISWTSAGSSTFFQSNWAPVGSGFNLSSYQDLDIRVDRIEDTALNSSGDTTFEVALVTSSGALSTSTFITNYGNRLDGPRSGPFNFHDMLQTIRIPLTDFGVSLTSIRGVRLTFSFNPSGHVYVGSIRATRVTTPPVPLMAPTITSVMSPLVALTVPTASAQVSSAVVPGTVPEPAPAGAAAVLSGPQLVSSGNAVTSLRSTPDGASVQVAVSSPVMFDAHAQLLTLRIGSVESTMSAYPSGDLRSVVFTLPRAAFDRLAGGEPITVRYGSGTSPIVWSFGGLDKTQLDR